MIEMDVALSELFWLMMGYVGHYTMMHWFAIVMMVCSIFSGAIALGLMVHTFFEEPSDVW